MIKNLKLTIIGIVWLSILVAGSMLLADNSTNPPHSVEYANTKPQVKYEFDVPDIMTGVRFEFIYTDQKPDIDGYMAVTYYIKCGNEFEISHVMDNSFTGTENKQVIDVRSYDKIKVEFLQETIDKMDKIVITKLYVFQ